MVENDPRLPVISQQYKKILEQFPISDVDRTPERVAKYLINALSGYQITPAEAVGQGIFDSDYKDVIKIENIHVNTMCKHHMLPFIGKWNIAYIPNGKILGISKFSRIVNVFAKRLQLQESLTGEIAQAVQDLVNAAGVLVQVRSKHFCSYVRGVEEKTMDVVTVAYTGVFENNKEERDKVLSSFAALSSKL